MRFLKRAAEPRSGDFVFAAPAANVVDESMTVVKIGGRKIILTRHEGVPFAIDAVCPHAAADLSQGSLQSWQICCHEHDYCFDIRNGRIVWPEDEVYRLLRYEVKEEDSRIWVNINSKT